MQDRPVRVRTRTHGAIGTIPQEKIVAGCDGAPARNLTGS
jgi:hypothetical protein